MNQKATPATKAQRGRPPTFDTDAVINGAVELFWSDGFEGTSLQDIAEALGIRSSTLYNSFGGKNGLYHSAIESYLATTDAFMFAPLRDGRGGMDDLISLLERQRVSLTHPQQPAGCLIINAMVTGQHAEVSNRYREQFLHAIDCALTRAADLGEIEAADRPMLGAALLSGIVGANITAKSGGTPAELNNIINGLDHTIRSWSKLAPQP